MAVERVLIGNVDFLRFKAGVLVLGLAVPGDDGREYSKVLAYEKTKTALFHYYCLRQGDEVQLRAVPSAKGGVLRLKSIVLVGQEPAELSERMNSAEVKYQEALNV